MLLQERSGSTSFAHFPIRKLKIRGLSLVLPFSGSFAVLSAFPQESAPPPQALQRSSPRFAPRMDCCLSFHREPQHGPHVQSYKYLKQGTNTFFDLLATLLLLQPCSRPSHCLQRPPFCLSKKHFLVSQHTDYAVDEIIPSYMQGIQPLLIFPLFLLACLSSLPSFVSFLTLWRMLTHATVLWAEKDLKQH